MPGTIHVSVLGFSDLPSASSSSVLFKVSMGKREYQTVDKGDFSFPVKSLREKLIVAVLDDVGSNMSQTVFEAIFVVQNGLWDDYFSLEGGGRVHMRLQFVLSDEDRTKIRKMRESALQKTNKQLLVTHPEFAKTVSLDVAAHNNGVSVGISTRHNDGYEAVQASPVGDSVSFSNIQPSVDNNDNKEGDAVSEGQTYPNDKDRGAEEAMPHSTASDGPAIHSAEANARALVEKQKANLLSVDKSLGTLYSELSTSTRKGKLFIPQTDDQDGTPPKEGQLRKTPSSVRKMISAFEGNTTKDAKPRNKPPPLRSPMNKLGLEYPSPDSVEDEVINTATKKLAEMSSEIVVKPSFVSELRQKVTAKRRQISPDVVEIITIAPGKNLGEAGADESVSGSREEETGESAVDAVDRFVAMPVEIGTEDMASLEDDEKVPTIEIRECIDSEDTELQNIGVQFVEDKMELLAVEKDNLNPTQGDSDTKYQNPPQDQMESLNGETANIISATEAGCDPTNDQTATVDGKSLDDDPTKQLVFDDVHLDLQDSDGKFMKRVCVETLNSEDPQFVKLEKDSTRKPEPTKSLTEWPPTCVPPSSWVFLDEPRLSCIAPSSTQLIHSVAGCNVGTNIHAGEHGMRSSRKPSQEKNREEKKVDEPSRAPSSNDSAGSGNPKGQFAQAIKIAIMVAFGALVFFSRQRNHR
uniref:Uncharacterized protein n=1 Tax=Kalanchoe fedtschenkoi TaxID=63787 RepID=A0A7N0TKG5_KALFE